MSICETCGNTGVETYEDTDSRGYLCTSSRPCPRCARHANRKEVCVIVFALAVLVGSVALGAGAAVLVSLVQMGWEAVR